MAQSLGAGAFFFLRKMTPLIRRDLFLIFSVLFSYFLTSISVPLIIGGGEMTSTEKLIYDQIWAHQNIAKALGYFAVQALLLFPLFAFAQSYTAVSGATEEPMRLWHWSGSRIAVFLPTAVIVLGLILRLPPGLKTLFFYEEFYLSLPANMTGSLLIGFFTGGVTALLLAFLSAVATDGGAGWGLRFLFVPGVTVLAWSFSRWSIAGPMSVLYAALALALIFAPILFRLEYNKPFRVCAIKSLRLAITELHCLCVCPSGLSADCPSRVLLSGLAAVWAMSDFAVSRLIVRADWSLGLWIESLVHQYRWDVALAACWILMGLGFAVFAFLGSGQCQS